jgi:lysophospholipase L1-like esterase
MIIRALAAWVLGIVAMAGAQTEKDYAVNADFAKGLQGWSVEGDVKAVPQKPIARFGVGSGTLIQRYDIGGLRIVWFGATFHAGNGKATAGVRIRCFDHRGRLLMDTFQASDPTKIADPKGQNVGVYLKTHAMTSYIMASVEASGNVDVSDISLQDHDHDRVIHTPTCNLDAYMTPFWKGDTVTNETVLLLSKNGLPASGQLMFPPTEILSVRDTTQTKSYASGANYIVDGRTLQVGPNPGDIATINDTDFPKGDYPWLSVAGKHILVTYRHVDRWTGPTPAFEGDGLPQTMAKLRARKPLTIAALGDSITLGIDVSGYRGQPPYMPTWADLFARQLGKIYGNEKIRLFNTGLGGMTAQWGRDNARDAVASLKPDLVLIAFGMNDFWSFSPADFRQNVQDTMAIIRKSRPSVEFILISSIKFDPAYTQDPTYVGHLADYAKELHALVGSGVRILDMTAISDAIYQAKSAKDVLADPMHPNDYLARWYAQGLVAMLDERR